MLITHSPTVSVHSRSVLHALFLSLVLLGTCHTRTVAENVPSSTKKNNTAKPLADTPPRIDGETETEANANKPDITDEVAVAKPVSGDLVRVYGWRESILLMDVNMKLTAKLDTGALTSSIHAEDKELFERDGKKWVRFVVSNPRSEKPTRHKIEAPLVRTAKIKEPGGKSEHREVVRLSFQIGERKLRGQFTLNNRSNMMAPVLLGRSIIQDLGWVDASRTDLADESILR